MTLVSVIIAVHDMAREAPRTVRSFLPPAQRGVDPGEYEIVVVDNGSPDPLDLSAIDPAGVSLRVERIAPARAHSSPVRCLNAAVRDIARGEALMLCIDGARMASPWLVRRARDVLARHPEAFVHSASRHLGRERQPLAVRRGYGPGEEDRLLAASRWEEDADRLWSISCWPTAHDPDEPLIQNESNAFALSRALWERQGGYLEGFSRPGGGLCNLEIFRRYLDRPGGLSVLLVGEATFHQVHGGAATSGPGYYDASLAEHRAVTGRDYAWPAARPLFDLGAGLDRRRAIACHLGLG